MPSLLSRKDKYVTPERKDQKRPLAYAQSTYAPSITSSLPSTYTPSISPSTTTLTPDDDDKPLVDDDLKRDQKSGVKEIADQEEDDFVRPKTPPQGSNYNPWSSYRDLPRDHPVFRYPDEMRENMYAKGVDPVAKAEMDLARLGKVYGKSTHGGSFVKRGTSMMGSFGTMATGGAF